jgi:hypothetical protein
VVNCDEVNQLSVVLNVLVDLLDVRLQVKDIFLFPSLALEE